MSEEKTAPPAIYAALASIMEETKAIGKTEKNQQQNFMFRGIDNIMNELHDLFAKHKVFILPEIIDYAVSEKVTKSGSLMYYTRAKICYHFMTIDGSEVTATNVGEAMDSGDKGMNKAMSASLKYALMQMLLIPTKDEKDPDQTTPPETRPKTIAEIADSLDPAKDGVLKEALNRIVNATDKETLMKCWYDFVDLQTNPMFSQCMSCRRKELGI
ncbi:MAG: ERF family protein [Muribaculaceae bacterium]|nr:ERF family protein [Muribaculaceae bacterium]